MNYAKEHAGQQSRETACESEAAARIVETLCGRGSVLGTGPNTGPLVEILTARGIDAREFNPASSESGNGLLSALPIAEDSFDTIIARFCLEHLPETALPTALAELCRISRRFVFVQLSIGTQGRDRAWWEHQFFAAGFRKHPLSQLAVSYEALENESSQITLIFEKIPAAALEKYPLTALKAERDLHMDMLREPGRRSDAHIARYMLARQYLPKTHGVVLDAACGLGYGAALLAQSSPTAQVIGMDNSEFATAYGETNFCPNLPNLHFLHGDVCDLRAYPDASVDLLASFETVEHLREPDVFLKEVKRILKPGGKFICSVPNLWVDEHGKDPNPWHFHVFDFPRLAGLCGEYFDLCDMFRQTAGGGMKLSDAPRALQKVQVPVTSRQDEAEWWLLVAEKPHAPRPELLLRAGDRAITVMTGSPGHSIYKSWLSRCPFPVSILNPTSKDVEIPDDALLFVTHDTYTEPGRTLIRKAVDKNIPTLILADGVLDYRNTWEHPQIEPGAIFQPVLGHKIATIGRSQSRWLESWGNAGRCETVGLPRLDRHPGLAHRERKSDEPFRILINTAITPYFTEAHQRQVTASLRDLKKFFDDNTALNGVRLEPIWRLTKGLDTEIGVSCQVSDLSGHEMAVTLKQVDAVITTPSTVLLEGMFFGLPVAVLDYSNTPHYIPTAWRITAQAHIGDTIEGLINPAEPKMLFQEACLHDSLECQTPAAPRLLRLMTEMVEHGLRARETKQPLSFPPAILQPEHSPAVLENRFRMEKLYSKQELAAPAPAPEQSSLSAINDPAKLRALAKAAGDSGRHAEAVEAYSKLLELNRRDTEALLGKAVHSAMQQHNVLARIHLEELLEIDPGNEAAKKCLASLPARKASTPPKPIVPTQWPAVSGFAPAAPSTGSKSAERKTSEVPA